MFDQFIKDTQIMHVSIISEVKMFNLFFKIFEDLWTGYYDRYFANALVTQGEKKKKKRKERSNHLSYIPDLDEIERQKKVKEINRSHSLVCHYNFACT